MKKVIYLTATLAFMGGMSMSGQTVKKDTVKARTVVVEQEYVPNKRKANRLLLTPKSDRPNATNKASKYDTSVQDNDRVVSEVMASTPASTGLFQAPLNSLHMGYGGNNYTVLDANFLTQLSDIDKLQGYVGLHGYNDGDTDLRTYTTTARMNYQRRLTDRIFEASGEVNNHVFNYLPSANQRHTSTDWMMRYDSRGKDWAVPFHSKIRLSTFHEAHPATKDANDETRLQIISGAQVKANQQFSLGGDVEINSLWYSLHGQEYYLPADEQHEYNALEGMTNYTTASLRPYFLFTPNKWTIRMGASFDLSFNNGRKIHVAPDVRAEYNLGRSTVFYANATGGKIINDFRRMKTVSPYSWLLARAGDTYEQLHANVGLRMSPAMGLWMNFCAGYQIYDDYLLQVPIVIRAFENQNKSGYCSFLLPTDFKRAYLTFDGQYSDPDWGMIDWKFAAYGNHSDEDDMLECMLPVYSMNLGVEYALFNTVKMRLGYQYEVRDDEDFKELHGAIDNVSNLSLSVTVPIQNNIEIWGSVVNLLDKEYLDYSASQVLGVTAFGGLTIKF